MSLSGAQRYTFEELREQFNNELLNKNMPERLYKSTDGIMRVINAIVKTKGQGWAAQVLNNDGKPLLTKEEQIKFTEAFQPYLETIIDYFGPNDDEMVGGQVPDVSKLSGLSSDFLKTKAAQATKSYPIPPFDPTTMPGPDDIYAKIVNRVGNLNSTVNNYASKYGVLKLEKEHDLEEDVRLIPQPAALAISEGVFALSTAADFPILPSITMEVLQKIKVPFRTIIFVIYLTLDIARLAMGIVGPALGRKILSILVAVLELLKGDWKKAILTFIGYYGMIPMLTGQLLKVFMTLFGMFAPQIQERIIFGSLDAAKSFIVGLLLAIFQVTAPEEVRLPLIGVLEKIAQHKAKMDGTLKGIGLSARPDYLSPTWEDLNNIQAVMNDKAYICSCEFKDLVNAVNKSAIIRIVLQILRIPVSQEMIEYQCGKEPCKDFVTTVVADAKARTKQEQKASQPFSMNDLKNPVDLNPTTSITAPVTNNDPTEPNNNPAAPNPTTGGRILHSRLKKIKP